MRTEGRGEDRGQQSEASRGEVGMGDLVSCLEAPGLRINPAGISVLTVSPDLGPEN